MPINKMHLDFPFTDSSVHKDDEDEEEYANYSMQRSFDTQDQHNIKKIMSCEIVALSCVHMRNNNSIQQFSCDGAYTRPKTSLLSSS